jgi:hypothetical protein
MGLRGIMDRDWGQKLVGNGAVDTQHGTGVEGGSHPCPKGYYPKNHTCYHTYIAVYYLPCKNTVYAIHISSSGYK